MSEYPAPVSIRLLRTDVSNSGPLSFTIDKDNRSVRTSTIQAPSSTAKTVRITTQ